MSEEKKSFWDRDLAEILGAKDTLATSGDVDKSAPKYMKYEKIMIDLNNSLPADLYFRTRYTEYGFDLYLYSIAANAALEMHVDLQSGMIFDDTQHVLCKYTGIVEYLKSLDFTTEDTSDDIEHDEFTIDRSVMDALNDEMEDNDE